MGQKLVLFNGGYAGSAPMLYFGLRDALQVFFVADEHVSDQVTSLARRVNEEADRADSALIGATRLAGEFSFSLPALPVDMKTYLPWHKSFVSQTERLFPLSRIEYYYFLYGRKLAELCSLSATASALVQCRDVAVAREELDYRIDSCLKDCEFGIFKLTAASALLAGEPRHSCFMNTYRQLSGAFSPFKQITPHQLSGTNAPELSSDLQLFAETTVAAYDHCRIVLEELDV